MRKFLAAAIIFTILFSYVASASAPYFPQIITDSHVYKPEDTVKIIVKVPETSFTGSSYGEDYNKFLANAFVNLTIERIDKYGCVSGSEPEVVFSASKNFSGKDEVAFYYEISHFDERVYLISAAVDDGIDITVFSEKYILLEPDDSYRPEMIWYLLAGIILLVAISSFILGRKFGYKKKRYAR